MTKTVIKEIPNPRVVMSGIAGLVILEVVALMNGINGTMYSLVIAAIAGLAGWALPFPIRKQ